MIPGEDRKTENLIVYLLTKSVFKSIDKFYRVQIGERRTFVRGLLFTDSLSESMAPSTYVAWLVLVSTFAVERVRSVIINTEYGFVYGRTLNVVGLKKQTLVNSFMGIPYARPPLGDLRFEVIKVHYRMLKFKTFIIFIYLFSNII